MKSEFGLPMEIVFQSVIMLLKKVLGEKCDVFVYRIENGMLKRILFEGNAIEQADGLIDSQIDIGPLIRNETEAIDTLIMTGGDYIRSVTIPLRKGEKIVGAITVRFDVTNLIFLQNQIQDITKYAPKMATEKLADISQLADHMLIQALEVVDKPVAGMKKADKKEFIKYLDERGYFQIKKSTEKVASFLDISKFTLYSCLEEIRAVNYDGNEFSDENNE